MIEIISEKKFIGDTIVSLTVSIEGKQYAYNTNSYTADKFKWMLRKKMGFKALNFLKKRAERG